MKYFKTILLFGLIYLLTSCGGEKDPMMSQIVGLAYWDIRNLVFENASGAGVEWHGEAVDQSAKSLLEMSKGGTCGQTDCGQAVLIQNNGDIDIEIILQVIHGIEDIYPYFSRKVLISAGEEAIVGCGQFCYEDEVMPLSYNIVGAVAISK